MSAPEIMVLVGFQTTPSFGQPFQLDDDVYGMLDTGTLGGIQFTDVTSQTQAITITRGRNRQTESFNAGTAAVTFRDPQRLFDPLNSDSPFYPYVRPRSPIQIFANGWAIYSGFITDWNLEYDYVTNGNVTTVACSDAFTVLANQVMNTWTPTEQLSGARIDAVLDRPEIAYQGGRFIDEGVSELGAFEVAAGTNVLQYLQLITASEQGYLFMNAKGALVFRDRFSTLNPVAEFRFTEDGTGIPYSKLTNSFGDELLFNYIQTQSPAGDVQTASDADSIALYQAQQFSKLDLLNSTVLEVDMLGHYLLGRYKDPVMRFTGVDVELAAISADDQNTLLLAQMTSLASVQKSFDVGTPASVEQMVIVSGISHTIKPGSHRIRFTFESADQNHYFTLDSDTFGQLDYNLLAF